MQFVKVLEGKGPIILTQPHGGTYIPNPDLHRYNKMGLLISDTDWHINKLYDGLLNTATVIQALFSRYLIDVNRDPYGENLYPKKTSTELCPTKNFFGQQIYKKGFEPNKEEIAKRLKNFHSVYHKAVSTQIQRIKEKHGIVLLFDCHSIKSHLPFLFDGELPDFNLGTNEGITCDQNLENIAVELCSKIKGYKFVLNGRFKGGWTIRHHSDIKNSIYSIQLELAQKTYMDESYPWSYNFKKAKNLRVHLKKLLNCLENYLLRFEKNR